MKNRIFCGETPPIGQVENEIFRPKNRDQLQANASFFDTN